MRLIKRHLIDYEFEDTDKNFDYFQCIVEMEDKQELSKIDADVICSMFELHKKLPSLQDTLFANGFLLLKNTLSSYDNQDASWKYEKTGEPTRILDYERHSWETDWNRSDHYHINMTYKSEQIEATYEYHDCVDDYGRHKENYRHCVLKKDDRVVFEKKVDYLKES